MGNKLNLRILIFIISLILCGIGTVLTTKSDIGTAPIATLPLVASYTTPFSFGLMTFALNITFILLQLILLKKDFPPKYFFQIIAIMIFSITIDACMFIFNNLTITNYIAKILYLILGSFILALGIFLEVKADIMLLPGDGLTKVISEKFNLNFGKVKIAFDFILCILAILLSVIGLRRLAGIGEGTIISAILVGNFIKLFIWANNRLKLLQ